MNEALVMLLFVIAASVVVRTVFYVIEVTVNTKATKKSLKLVNRLMKAYEPMLDYLKKYMDDNDL